MSSPTQLKLDGPNVIDGRIRRRYLIPYLIQVFISILPGIAAGFWWFDPSVPYSARLLLPDNWIYWALTPLAAFIAYYMMLIWSCIVARVRLGWLKLLHPIKEGIFLRHPKDKDYKYWCLRNYARLFPGWLAATVPFPWLKVFCNYIMMGVKVGKRCLLNVGWVSQELIEIGNDVKVHQSACVLSWYFEGEKLFLKKVVLEDGVIVGAKSVIYPGCILRKGVVVSACSFMMPMSETEPNCTYFGTPVKLVKRDTEYFKTEN